MKPGTRCPIEDIKFVDEFSNTRVVSCYDEEGFNKGLLGLARELKITLPNRFKLADLREILAEHPAFELLIANRTEKN